MVAPKNKTQQIMEFAAKRGFTLHMQTLTKWQLIKDTWRLRLEGCQEYEGAELFHIPTSLRKGILKPDEWTQETTDVDKATYYISEAERIIELIKQG